MVGGDGSHAYSTVKRRLPDSSVQDTAAERLDIKRRHLEEVRLPIMDIGVLLVLLGLVLLQEGSAALEHSNSRERRQVTFGDDDTTGQGRGSRHLQ